MLKMESGRFNEFVGAQVSEVKVNSNVDEEWLWLEGQCNPADLGTRPTVIPWNLVADSDYQEGMVWMKKPEEKWPCKRSFGVVPKGR